jgi:flagellar L-ring protein precursor FlgH
VNAHRPAAPAAPLLLLLAVVAALFGCASTPFMPASVYEQPMPTLEQVPPAGPVSPGSLFTDTNAADLAGDFRARHTGDVLIVRVRETSLGKSASDKKLGRQSTNTLDAPVAFGWEDKVDFGLDPALSTSTDLQFDGKGETTRESELTATIAVRVMAVGSGGPMLVVGQKDVKVNQERQRLTLAGIVRPEDIARTNVIDSARIADLTITYGGFGDINDTTRQPWFQRLLAVLWPF